MTIPISIMRSRIEDLQNIPSIPAILVPLMRQLDGANQDIDVKRIADLVSHDKSLAAQTLRMANSPLFGRWKQVDSIKSAIITLGLQRLREITTACFMLNLLPKGKTKVDITSFWEHSLACALVSRRLAKRISMPDPDKAYLAGLLHDIGLIVNVLVIGEAYEEAVLTASKERQPIGVIEERNFGISHALSGEMLADQWKLGADIKEVIRRHHQLHLATDYRSLVAVVNLSDLLCRVSRLGYGYDEDIHIDLHAEEAWKVLAEQYPQIINLDVERLTFELDDYVKEVRNLVSVLFRL